MIGQDIYYSRQEVSNSDLGEVEKYFMSSERAFDVTQAYRFGNLIDAMITEKHRCNHLLCKVDNEQFSSDEWQTAYAMLNAFRADPYCAAILKQSTGQNVFTNPSFLINHYGFKFTLPVRCKFDLFMHNLGYGADIKSTTATSQRQFEEAIRYFNYDRQRAWYMDIPMLMQIKQDMLIGISKKNFKVFKVPIRRNDELYNSGKAKYLQSAFMYWTLFEGLDIRSGSTPVTSANLAELKEAEVTLNPIEQ